MADRAKSTNRLLAGVPESEFRRLEPHLLRMPVELKATLGEAGAQIERLYFPADAVISILTRMEEGQSVEIATIGSEGLVGLPAAMGAESMNPREAAVVQVPGDVVAMDVEQFRREMAAGGAFATLVWRYGQAFLSQVAQQVACNGLHSVEQRCARWLLLTHDRVGMDEFPMTHEFLAQMLGVRRASVTVTAGVFQRAGFVTFHRGRVTIVDRPGLEATSCECYGVIREVFDRLLP